MISLMTTIVAKNTSVDENNRDEKTTNWSPDYHSQQWQENPLDMNLSRSTSQIIKDRETINDCELWKDSATWNFDNDVGWNMISLDQKKKKKTSVEENNKEQKTRYLFSTSQQKPQNTGIRLIHILLSLQCLLFSLHYLFALCHQPLHCLPNDLYSFCGLLLPWHYLTQKRDLCKFNPHWKICVRLQIIPNKIVVLNGQILCNPLHCLHIWKNVSDYDYFTI